MEKLYDAIYNNDITSAENLIKIYEINKNNADFRYAGGTPLHMAALYGHKEIVEILIVNKANVNITDNYGETPLHYAVLSQNKEIIEILIVNGAKVNITDHNGATALHFAVNAGNIEIVNELIKAKADINIVDKFGQTPLLWSFAFNSIEVAIQLINQGAYLIMSKTLAMQLKDFFDIFDANVNLALKTALGHKLLFNTLSNFPKTGFENVKELIKTLNESSKLDLNSIIEIVSMPLRLFSTAKAFKAAAPDSEIDDNYPEISPAILSNEEHDNDVKDIISTPLSSLSFDDDQSSALIGQD